MKEIWKDIKGYEGIYQVSNMGNIRSLNYNRTGKTKMLKTRISDTGYVIIGLNKNNKSNNHRVHRLVAEAFIPNVDSKPEVNHIDGNKENNTVDNLEWTTKSENVKHAYKNGLCEGQRKSSQRIKCITTGEVFNSVADADKRYNIRLTSRAYLLKKQSKLTYGTLPDGTKLEWEYTE